MTKWPAETWLAIEIVGIVCFLIGQIIGSAAVWFMLYRRRP